MTRPASPSAARPSREGLVLGVTGHRTLADEPRLEAAVIEVVERLEARDSTPAATLLSGLAEGADRLVARILIARGVRLTAVLPRPAADYESDFRSSDSIDEFRALLARAAETIVMPPQQSREAGYRLAGQYLVDHCGVLIALWDGGAPASTAGTGAMVARARAAARPLAWIHAGNTDPATGRPTSLGPGQGLITWERL